VTGASGQARFGDRVAEAVARRRSQLVLGLDPDPARLWPSAAEAAVAAVRPGADPRELAGRAVATHCDLVIEATAEHCAAVKFQVACFERLGAPGWTALDQAARGARERGLLVFADAKRGDIDVSAAAYAQAFFGVTPTPFGPVEGLAVDALTVNPLLGADSLAPLVVAARATGAGLFVLVHTSNPGAADVQELALAAGQPVSVRLADLVDRLGSDGIGASGLADVGAVVGATAPAWIGPLRERMPHAIFLLPGVGAQGGTIDGLHAAFTPGPAGGLISVSRAIVDAHARLGGDPAAAARAEAARLRELVWAVAA
jgi:orotidine-5'-phosphate decarboxylase